MRRLAAWLPFALLPLAAAACAGSPCDAFSARSCIALSVDGDADMRVDQLRVRVAVFGLDALSPAQPLAAPVAPPIVLALLAPPAFIGSFSIDLEARAGGVRVGAGVAAGLLTSDRASATVFLGMAFPERPDLGPDFAHAVAPDLISGDLVGLDPDNSDLAGLDADAADAAAPDLLLPVALGTPCQHDSDCNRGQVCAIIHAPLGVCTVPCTVDGDCGLVTAERLSEFGVGSACMVFAAPAGCSIPCDPTVSQLGCSGGYVCGIDLAGTTATCEPPSSSATRVLNQSCSPSAECQAGLTCAVGFCKTVCRARVPSDCAGTCSTTGDVGFCN
jgi:hypothetical protein